MNLVLTPSTPLDGALADDTKSLKSLKSTETNSTAEWRTASEAAETEASSPPSPASHSSALSPTPASPRTLSPASSTSPSASPRHQPRELRPPRSRASPTASVMAGFTPVLVNPELEFAHPQERRPSVSTRKVPQRFTPVLVNPPVSTGRSRSGSGSRSMSISSNMSHASENTDGGDSDCSRSMTLSQIDGELGRGRSRYRRALPDGSRPPSRSPSSSEDEGDARDLRSQPIISWRSSSASPISHPAPLQPPRRTPFASPYASLRNSPLARQAFLPDVGHAHAPSLDATGSSGLALGLGLSNVANNTANTAAETSGMHALMTANKNAARAVAGLPLLPVHLNGAVPTDRPPLSSAEAIASLSKDDQAAWTRYYLGEEVRGDRATAALRVCVGLDA